MNFVKFIFGLAFAGFTLGAQAQSDAQKDAVLNSPYLAKAKTCINDFTAAGKTAGLMTDRDGGTALILDPANKQKLGEILGGSFECLDKAFEMTRKKVDRAPNAGQLGTKSWIWYASVSGLYIWCASDGDSTPENVGYLSGHGERKNWYAIAVQCSISDKVLGWYTPDS